MSSNPLKSILKLVSTFLDQNFSMTEKMYQLRIIEIRAALRKTMVRLSNNWYTFPEMRCKDIFVIAEFRAEVITFETNFAY